MRATIMAAFAALSLMASSRGAVAASLIELYFSEVQEEVGRAPVRQSVRISLRDEGGDTFTLETVRNWDAALSRRIVNETAGPYDQTVRYSLGNSARVVRLDGRYLVTNFIQNFRLVAVLTPGGSCRADVNYPLAPGQTLYRMFSKDKVRHLFTRLSAEDVHCSVKALGES